MRAISQIKTTDGYVIIIGKSVKRQIASHNQSLCYTSTNSQAPNSTVSGQMREKTKKKRGRGEKTGIKLKRDLLQQTCWTGDDKTWWQSPKLWAELVCPATLWYYVSRVPHKASICADGSRKARFVYKYTGEGTGLLGRSWCGIKIDKLWVKVETVLALL